MTSIWTTGGDRVEAGIRTLLADPSWESMPGPTLELVTSVTVWLIPKPVSLMYKPSPLPEACATPGFGPGPTWMHAWLEASGEPGFWGLSIVAVLHRLQPGGSWSTRIVS